MTIQMQLRTDTQFDRYPSVFAAASLLQRKLQVASHAPRILSFGCSSGEELLSLEKYFPGAVRFGCDVDLEMLSTARARDPGATVFESTEQNIRRHGPYDVVFAMSVLCYHGSESTPREVVAKFPFSKFSESIELLRSSLTETGLLVAFNTSYFVEDVISARDFVSIRAPMVFENGFVNRYVASGERVAERRVEGEIGYYDYVGDSRPDSSFSNVFFARLNSHRDEALLVCPSIWLRLSRGIVSSHRIDDTFSPLVRGVGLQMKRSVWNYSLNGVDERVEVRYRRSIQSNGIYHHGVVRMGSPLGGDDNPESWNLV